MDGRFCAATDKALCFVKADGSVSTYDYQGANLARCSINGGKFAAVLLENYSSGGLTHLATVNTAGEEIAALTVDSQVLDLSAAGRYVAVSLHQQPGNLRPQSAPVRRVGGCEFCPASAHAQ